MSAEEGKDEIAEDEEEEDLEKLEAEIARMEAEAARITKETEQMEKNGNEDGKAEEGGAKESGTAKLSGGQNNDAYVCFIYCQRYLRMVHDSGGVRTLWRSQRRVCDYYYERLSNV